MILQYASDLHLEMIQNHTWLTEFPLVPVSDILIVAGDLTYLNKTHLENPLIDQLSKEFRQVYVVPGNHEFYVRSYDIADCFPSLKFQVRKNITYLNNQTIILDRCRIVFTTLFSHISNHQLIERKLNDFHSCVYGGERFSTQDYNQCHEECKRFLEKELANPFDGATIVVSHHAPYPPEYCSYNFDGLLNEAFHVDMSYLLDLYKIDHWIHGHTHHNLKPFQIGNTWFHTNQLGYTFYNEHQSFNKSATIKW
uniref:Calcineurin-like phosphoesterase domain-containing protein n=1 Tax=Microscilla sp. PRE1 TaxID=155537 RepID=Q93P73_9BACT|nr:metallophosphoesterase [Microscilla sp. PRE1]AAK62880.1 MS158, hypothetical protein [Microscilla sp. PRE1]